MKKAIIRFKERINTRRGYEVYYKEIPKILETPYVEQNPPYKEEIEMIRNKSFNNNLIGDILK